jgi:molecular chaperone Hsp33
MMDDFVAPFSLDAAPVRGRVTRLGASALNTILRRHVYPRPVAMLLGEALCLAALIGSLLKADGRLIVQTQSVGPVGLLVAEYDAGNLRGYARVADGAADSLLSSGRMPLADLLGAGNLAITLDQGDGRPTYQGVTALEGETLAHCAQSFFRASEQTDTAICLAVGEALGGDAPAQWRGGGILMQRVAGDQARGDTSEDWLRASHLFATVRDEELIDPDLAADRLLYRLFHQEGVRMGEPAALRDQCSCNEQRLAAVMHSFPATEIESLVEPDGTLHARCQFCARDYKIKAVGVGAA